MTDMTSSEGRIRNVENNIGDIKTDIAVIKSNQEHTNTILSEIKTYMSQTACKIDGITSSLVQKADLHIVERKADKEDLKDANELIESKADKSELNYWRNIMVSGIGVGIMVSLIGIWVAWAVRGIH